MKNKKLRLILPTESVYVAGLLGIAAASLSLKYLAAICFFFILGNMYNLLRMNFDNLLASAFTFQISIIQSSAVYLFGQYAFAGSSVAVISIAYVFMVGFYFALSRFLKVESVVQINAPMILGIILLRFVYAIPVWGVIQFLGLGYDNYGHVNVIRKILVDRKFFYNELNPSNIPSFASNTPMGGHALVSFLGQVIGVDGSDYIDFLKFYLFAFVLLLVFFFWIAFSIARKNLTSLFSRFLLFVLMMGILFYSYLSHIWISGYFSSNISTVLVLIAVGVLVSEVSSRQKLVVLFSLIGTAVYIYPLYAVLVGALVATICCLEARAIFMQMFSIDRNLKAGAVVALIYFGFIAAVSMLAMMNGFGTGHFLAAGGIEPMPIGTAMFIFGISLVLLDETGVFGGALRIAARAVIAVNFVAICGVLYAFAKSSVPGEQWFIPYYPTKIAISALVVTFVFLLRYLLELNQASDLLKRTINTKKLVISGAVCVFFLSSAYVWPFTGGYMGSTRGAIESIWNSKSEVVDGRVVEAAAEAASISGKPVLYLSDIHESELNTRWINSLQFKWNDTNWTNSTDARSLIESEDYLGALKIVNNGLMIVVDHYSNFDENPTAFDLFEDLCVIKAKQIIECK